MPELPDVEGFRRTFAAAVHRRRVLGLHADPAIVRNTTPQALGRALHGARFEAPRRHGKWLMCPAGARILVLHFGMTGGLRWVAGGGPRHPHDRLVLVLGGSRPEGELRYRSQRKLGGVWLATAGGDVIGELGPDARDTPPHEVAAHVAGRRAALKAVLLDQRTVAGLGNLTSDEILWRAGLDPRRRASALDEDDLRAFGSALRWVLERACAAGRVPDRSGWLTGARRRDGRCPRCGTPLRRAAVAGRTTYWCPACQR